MVRLRDVSYLDRDFYQPVSINLFEKLFVSNCDKKKFILTDM